MTLREGFIAPVFSLYDSEKKKVSLTDFRGQNILLLFFPLAFTGTCTKELCSIRDSLERYNNLDTQVLGISVDSLYTLARYKADQNLNFPLLSDFNKTVSELYGSLYETFGFEMQGVSKRSAFVVDREGIIKYAQVLENASEVPDFDKIQEKLATLM